MRNFLNFTAAAFIFSASAFSASAVTVTTPSPYASQMKQARSDCKNQFASDSHEKFKADYSNCVKEKRTELKNSQKAKTGETPAAAEPNANGNAPTAAVPAATSAQPAGK